MLHPLPPDIDTSQYLKKKDKARSVVRPFENGADDPSVGSDAQAEVEATAEPDADADADAKP